MRSLLANPWSLMVAGNRGGWDGRHTMNVLGKALVGFLLVTSLAFVGGGVFLIVERETGTRAQATVARCVESGGGRLHRTDCTGTWVLGGHVVVGTIEGADSSDVGKTNRIEGLMSILATGMVAIFEFLRVSQMSP